MFDTDLHSHTHFSACGMHSILEVLTRAKEKGLKGQAITDHGPFLGRKISSVFFERLGQPVEGIRLFKGMELNITDADGNTDVVYDFMQWYDILLAGFHNFPQAGMNSRFYTGAALSMFRRNPFVDIFVHPNAPEYPIDFRAIAAEAANTGAAIEINNSKTALRRSPDELTMELIEACKTEGCLIAVNTDSHVLSEIGDTSAVAPLLKQANFPVERIVNSSLESASEWLENRKRFKLEAVPRGI